MGDGTGVTPPARRAGCRGAERARAAGDRAPLGAACRPPRPPVADPRRALALRERGLEPCVFVPRSAVVGDGSEGHARPGRSTAGIGRHSASGDDGGMGRRRHGEEGTRWSHRLDASLDSAEVVPAGAFGRRRPPCSAAGVTMTKQLTWLPAPGAFTRFDTYDAGHPSCRGCRRTQPSSCDAASTARGPLRLQRGVPSCSSRLPSRRAPSPKDYADARNRPQY